VARVCEAIPDAVFGKLTVLGEGPRRGEYHVSRVRCECGSEKEIRTANLGDTKSCGCALLMGKGPPRIDLAGQRYDRLRVIERVATAPGAPAYVRVQCDCGSAPKSVRLTALRSGDTKSCGCLSRERRAAEKATPGPSRIEPEYSTWRHMIRRCERPEWEGFANYGGRGIGVCARWRESFAAFLADMGRRPGDGYSIDRINNDGNYEPDNCRWATQREQCRNRRVTRLVEFRGERLLIAEWAERLGMSHAALEKRFQKGWPIERVLTEPVRYRSCWRLPPLQQAGA
jgi:hypothetical protein